MVDVGNTVVVWGVVVTTGKAKQIRSWRVDQQLTWRSVAAAASGEWELNHGSSQLSDGTCARPLPASSVKILKTRRGAS